MTKPKEHWEKRKEDSMERMRKIWPKIQKLRASLNVLQNIHDEYQASLYEAEYHLVEVVKLKPAESAKVKNTHWMKKILTLTPKERRELARKLESSIPAS